MGSFFFMGSFFCMGLFSVRKSGTSTRCTHSLIAAMGRDVGSPNSAGHFRARSSGGGGDGLRHAGAKKVFEFCVNARVARADRFCFPVVFIGNLISQ